MLALFVSTLAAGFFPLRWGRLWSMPWHKWNDTAILDAWRFGVHVSDRGYYNVSLHDFASEPCGCWSQFPTLSRSGTPIPTFDLTLWWPFTFKMENGNCRIGGCLCSLCRTCALNLLKNDMKIDLCCWRAALRDVGHVFPCQNSEMLRQRWRHRMAIFIIEATCRREASGRAAWVGNGEVYAAALQMLMLNVHPWPILPTPNVSGKWGAWLMRIAYGHPSMDKETTKSIDWRWTVVFYLFVMRPYLNDDDPGK